MIGERENKYTDTDYGKLHMRSYVIDGDEINAFYDLSDNLVFVLDNTVNAKKPNILLVINPSADRKWDEILSDDYDVDLETIRPKQDNKYQKLDIEYSGLNVYEKLINAYVAGDSLDVELNQLNVLRDSAARHSAMVRLTMANETISKTNATIVKTKETIVRLNERVKSLRAKLAATKKEIGRVPTKQSASRVLKLESQIEATNEKLKRAKKRLESAQRRLEIATVDAELASELLNQPSTEIKTTKKQKSKSVPMGVLKSEKKTVTVKEEPDFDEYEEKDDYENDTEQIVDNEEIDVEIEEKDSVKPLFKDDPQILNDDIAFKPISFDVVSVPEVNNHNETYNETNVNNVNIEIPKSDVDMNSGDETPESEDKPEIPYLNNEVFMAPEIKQYEQTEKINQPEDTFMPVPVEKPVLESLAPVNNVPELSPEFNQVVNESESSMNVDESDKDERPVLESMTAVERQPEPVYDPDTDVPSDNNFVKNIPVNNHLIAPMTEDYHAEIVGQETKHRPTFLYYLLLIVLIVLSVFTLWLYQRSVGDTSPVLTADVEKTSVLKKTGKTKKVSEPVVVKEDSENESVFLDDKEPVEKTVDVVKVSEPEIDYTDTVETVTEPSQPVVMNDVPARVMSSGETDEQAKTIPTEDEILASKPVYEPGTKHEAMFVTEDDNNDCNDNNDYVVTDYADDEYTEQNHAVVYETEYSDVNTGLSDVVYVDEKGVDYDDTFEMQQQYPTESDEYTDEYDEIYYEE